jgi:hypothetical protein
VDHVSPKVDARVKKKKTETLQTTRRCQYNIPVIALLLHGRYLLVINAIHVIAIHFRVPRSRVPQFDSEISKTSPTHYQQEIPRTFPSTSTLHHGVKSKQTDT